MPERGSLQQEGLTQEVERALRSLVAAATADGRSARAASEAVDEEVLLDVEVDGYHCVLSGPNAARVHCHHALSRREEQIARMVAAGYPNKTIAATLDISTWTVSTYLRRIFVKLDVHTRAAMVARLFETASDQPRRQLHGPEPVLAFRSARLAATPDPQRKRLSLHHAEAGDA